MLWLPPSLGGLTDAVDGRVSPLYFVTIVGWRGVDDVWRAGMAQGLFEGLVFGVFFSPVFTSGVGIHHAGIMPLRIRRPASAGMVAGALVCRLIGGTAAMGLAALRPEFYRRAFLGVSEEFGPMLRYA